MWSHTVLRLLRAEAEIGQIGFDLRQRLDEPATGSLTGAQDEGTGFRGDVLCPLREHLGAM